MLRISGSIFLATVVIVEFLLCDRDFLGYWGEDWRTDRRDPVESGEGSDNLLYLHGDKLVCHRFMDGGRRHAIPGSETKESALVIAMAVSTVSACTLVSRAHFQRVMQSALEEDI